MLRLESQSAVIYVIIFWKPKSIIQNKCTAKNEKHLADVSLEKCFEAIFGAKTFNANRNG